MKRGRPALSRYHVIAYEPTRKLGSVLLSREAPRHEVEHALVVFGIHAPRGLDMLIWTPTGEAEIQDASGHTIVALFSDAFVKRMKEAP